MTKKRIVPCLDIINNRVVVGEQFQNLQDVADPLSLARNYEQSQADDLIIYDISGKNDTKQSFLALIKKISAIVSMPLTVGGGIETVDDIAQMLAHGADRVSINSSAIHNKQFLQDAIDTFGGKRIVLAIDAKKLSPGKWHAFTKGGKKDSGLDVFSWAKRAEQMGVAEIVLNSIDADGAKSGFAIELNERMVKTVDIPVIASGGAGNVHHFSKVFQKTKVAGALAASIFHQQHVTIQEVKQHLQTANKSEGSQNMEQIIDRLTWQKAGLIPAIVQDYQSKDVLMLAYMNRQSLEKTLQTRETWFFSRSRRELWHKGATSGNKQSVKEISYDCDRDTLLILVEPMGPACHTGETSCFFTPLVQANDVPSNRQIITKLTERIKTRFEQPTDDSYTTYLFNEGIDKILKKIGEEASEIIIAAKNDDAEELVWEIADFIYHSLVLMQLKNITVEHIYAELEKRFGDKEGETK